MPYRKKIKPMDSVRGHQSVNGWVVQFPNISITLSLDKRRHPNRVFWKLSPSLTKSNTELLVSTSIHPESKEYKFMAIETRNNELMLKQMRDIFAKSRSNHASHPHQPEAEQTVVGFSIYDSGEGYTNRSLKGHR